MARKKKLERDFQPKVMEEIKQRLPGALVTKFEGEQGWPDLLILYEDKWAMLECKKEEKAIHQPNQDYYVEMLNSMSFSRFVYPENKEEVLDELEQALQTRGTARTTRRKQTKLGDG